MISVVVIVAIGILLLGYLFYGKFLAGQMKLDDSHPTPACEINDGVDYVPAKPALLLGQHFSAISAAGPIVGPILAGIWFGWLPALLWIIIGSIFIGGVHDFTSLVASIRHKAASIGEIVKGRMSRTSHILFLTFVWLALVYVIIAFTDITAHTFKIVSKETAFGPGVAASSIFYLLAGGLLGILLYKFKLNLTIATIIFLPLVLFIIWVGPRLPEPLIAFLSNISVKQWDVFLLIYCFIASVIPMWLLLQPRGYLGGWFLYLIILICIGGTLFGGFKIEYPAINLEGMKSLANGKLIFPVLFVTIACGAISGFHGIVSSGTTSKQLYRESNARVIGYGGMLLEGLVAVLALATVMMIPKGDVMLGSEPNLIYANGIARYLGFVGIGFNLALAFALLAFATFVYDTLDVCTRLARYILQELMGLKGRGGAFLATFLTLLLPFIFLMCTQEKGYLVAWPVFGTSNQLLASLILLAISVWLIQSGKNALYTIIPMIFMMAVTLWSLVLLSLPFLTSLPALFSGIAVKPDIIIAGICGIILFILSICLILEAINVLVVKKVGGSK
ncbi:MAG: carbon starvation CstA family protein [Nitrospirota bacterium]